MHVLGISPDFVSRGIYRISVVDSARVELKNSTK